jgi:hypothetical protein
MILTFLIAFVQIGLISSQIFYIAKHNYMLAFFTSIGISSCWLFNVNKAIKGNRLCKIAYTVGASLGTVVSIYLNTKILGG